MNIFNLHGPEFLALYAALFVAVWVGVAFLRRALRGNASTEGINGSQLHPLEIAYLNGGGRLALSAALTSLERRGAIAADPKTKQFTPLPGGNLAQLHDAEGLVLEHVRNDNSPRVGQLQTKLNWAFSFPRLDQWGLQVGVSQRVFYGLLNALPFGLLTFCGVMKILIGISRNKPVLFLTLMCIVSAGATAVALFTFPRLTRRGEALLKQLQRSGAALKTSVQASPATIAFADVALAVGLFGPAVLAGTEVAALRGAIAPFGVNGASCASGGSSCSSGGASGCGSGGGCGGGGCGGCGGGGD